MKLYSIVSEAIRDALSGTSRTVLYAFAFGAVLAIPVAADVLTTTAIVEEAHEFQASGSSVVTVIAPESIDARACEALNQVENVNAAGAIQSTDIKLTLATISRSPVDLFQVTNGFLDVVKAQQIAPSGVAFTSDVLEALGGSPTEVETNVGSVSVGGSFVYPSDGRRPGFGWAALEPSPAVGLFDECWVEIWPYTDALRASLLTSVAASTSHDVKVTVTQLNTQHGSTFNGVETFSDRFTRLSPVLTFTLGFLAAMLSIRVRRLEFASRLHDGADHRALQSLAVLEGFGWLAPGALFSLVAGIGLLSDLPAADAMPILGTQVFAASCAVLGGMLGSALAVYLVKERHLFSYFKDR